MSECAGRTGAGSAASHLVSGHGAEHERLEEELAEFTGRERALLFSSGYLANLAVISALAGRGERVLLDRLSHASLIDGARLSGAEAASLRARRRARCRAPARRPAPEPTALIATDGVFSMDGDTGAAPRARAPGARACRVAGGRRRARPRRAGRRRTRHARAVRAGNGRSAAADGYARQGLRIVRRVRRRRCRPRRVPGAKGALVYLHDGAAPAGRGRDPRRSRARAAGRLAARARAGAQRALPRAGSRRGRAVDAPPSRPSSRWYSAAQAPRSRRSASSRRRVSGSWRSARRPCRRVRRGCASRCRPRTPKPTSMLWRRRWDVPAGTRAPRAPHERAACASRRTRAGPGAAARLGREPRGVG